jgi:hypothetical protein
MVSSLVVFYSVPTPESPLPRMTTSTPNPRWEVEESVAEEERVRERVADALNDPTGRFKLFLENMQAPSLPDDIGRIASLRELYISNCPKLTQLPTSIAKLCDSLQIIDAENCGLTSLPEEFKYLHSLKKLNLKGNALTEFLWDPVRWKNLESLNLSGNRIRALSHLTLPMIQNLLRMEKRAKETQLHAKRVIFLEGNAFLTPTDYPPSQWSLTTFPQSNPLADLLPPSVDSCVICGETIMVGNPMVYLHFQYIESIVKDSPAAVEPTRVRVAFLFPHCSNVSCCKKLYDSLCVARMIRVESSAVPS